MKRFNQSQFIIALLAALCLNLAFSSTTQAADDPFVGTWYFYGYDMSVTDSTELAFEAVTRTITISYNAETKEYTFVNHPDDPTMYPSKKGKYLIEEYYGVIPNGDNPEIVDSVVFEYNVVQLIDKEFLFITTNGSEFAPHAAFNTGDDIVPQDLLASWGSCGFATKDEFDQDLLGFDGEYKLKGIINESVQGYEDQAYIYEGYFDSFKAKDAYTITQTDVDSYAYVNKAGAIFPLAVDGETLIYQDEDLVLDNDSHYTVDSFFIQAPNGYLTYLNCETEYDTELDAGIGDLSLCYWDCFMLDLSNPKDLASDLTMDTTDSSLGFQENAQVLPGDKLEIPVTITNLERGYAKGKVNLSIYLEEDGILLGELTNKTVKVSPLSSYVLECKFTVPENVLPGTYSPYIILDTTNVDGNLGASIQTATLVDAATVEWSIGNIGREKIVKSLTFDTGTTGPVSVSFKGDGYCRFYMPGEAPLFDITDPSVYGNPLTDRDFDVIDALNDLGPTGDFEVKLYSTTADTTLKISSKDKDHTPVIGNLTTDLFTASSAKSIDASSCDLDGSITVNGSLESLKLNDASGTIFVKLASQDPTSFDFNNVTDLTISMNFSTLPVGTVSANQWLNTDITADYIDATYLEKLTVKGDCQLNLNLTGANAPDGETLGSVKISGSLSSVDWDITGSGSMEEKTFAMGKVDVKGDVIDTSIHVTSGNANSFTANAMDNSELFVGTTDGLLAITGSVDDFEVVDDLGFYIKSISLKSKLEYIFTNDSVIAAWEIGKITFKQDLEASTGTVEYSELGSSKNVSEALLDDVTNIVIG